MGIIKKIVRYLVHHLGNVLRFFQMTYLRSAGVVIGTNTMISLRAKIDVRRGEVVIGDNCLITYGCVVLSHDYASKLLGREAGKSKVVIGNKVFVGVNSVIMPGVTIGNNCIIGSGSVVTKDIPDNVIAVGNPARVIKEIPVK